MKTKKKMIITMITAFLLTGSSLYAQVHHKMHEPKNMYLIKRTIPDAGDFTKEQLRDISRGSNSVVANLGPDIKWIHSYVLNDKVFCVYKAGNKELIRKHAKQAKFPIDTIYQVGTVISPATANLSLEESVPDK